MTAKFCCFLCINANVFFSHNNLRSILPIHLKFLHNDSWHNNVSDCFWAILTPPAFKQEVQEPIMVDLLVISRNTTKKMSYSVFSHYVFLPMKNKNRNKLLFFIF